MGQLPTGIDNKYGTRFSPFSRRSFAELAQLVRSVTIRSVFGSHAAVPIPEAPRELLVVSGVSGLGLVQVYTLISPGRSGPCLHTCTDRRNLAAPSAGYKLKRPYICRLTMSGLKTKRMGELQSGVDSKYGS